MEANKPKALSFGKTEIKNRQIKESDNSKPFDSGSVDLPNNQFSSRDMESSFQIANDYIAKNNRAIYKIMNLKSIETAPFEVHQRQESLLTLMNKGKSSGNLFYRDLSWLKINLVKVFNSDRFAKFK